MSKKILRSMLSVVLCFAIVFGIGTGIISYAAASSVGDTVEYGSYPQTEVKNNSVIADLNSLVKTSDFKSYGYYSGKADINTTDGSWRDGQMKASDYMKYVDVSYNGEKYRGVTFTAYRPSFTGYKAVTDSAKSYQDDNGYVYGKTYWFKYEPLKWKIVDAYTTTEGDKAGLAVCESIIDAQAFNNYVLREYDSKTDVFQYYREDKKTYANDYASSSIRTWLNGTFYNTAFVASGADISLMYKSYFNKSDDFSLKYSKECRTDSVFLLSVKEANAGYKGLASANDKKAQGTDYAKCQGLYVASASYVKDNSYWRLRTPGTISSATAFVGEDGAVYNSDTMHNDVDFTCSGVRPAIRIALCKHVWGEWQTVKEPTLNSYGLEKRTCKICGYTQSRNIDPLDPHFAHKKITILGLDESGIVKVHYRNKVHIIAKVDIPIAGSKIEWWIDGKKVATSPVDATRSEITTDELKKDSIVVVKYINQDGYVIKDIDGNEVSETETINVNRNIFFVIIGFIRHLIGRPRVVEQYTGA